MRTIVGTLFFLFCFFLSPAQETKKDSTVIYYLIGNDSVLRASLELDEVIVTGQQRNKAEEDRKKFLLLQRRVLKVYPFAKSGADHLIMLQLNKAKLRTEREKRSTSKSLKNI